MSASDAVFWGFAILTLAAACAVAFSSSILRSGFSLLLCFFGVAGVYVLLGADLLAGVQVLLYVGGIVVLILFAILVTSTIRGAHVSSERGRGWPSALAISLVLFAALCWAILSAFPRGGAPAPVGPTSAAIGDELLRRYLLPFEAVSILLLVALMGAALLIRKEVRPESEGPEALAEEAEREKERLRA